MASSKEVIELLFNAEYAGKAEVRALKRDLNDLAGDFSSGVSTVSTYTAALAGIEAAAIAASIGLAKAGVSAAGDFNAGFAEISTLITDVDADLGAFKKEIQDYAVTSTASFEDINGALYNAISAGVSYKDSIEFLAQAEKLSVAGKTSLNDAVKILTGTLSAYGQETDQAGKFSDILFSTVKNGVTTVPELAGALGQVTGTAASLGVSFEDVSASVATLTKAGVGTSQSITSLKAAISNIIKPSKDAQDTAEKLGISLGTSALESKGFAGVLEEIAIKTGGSKEEISKLFGSTEALNAILALTSEQGLKTFKTDLDSITNSAGSTEAAFAKMAENVNLIKQTLENNIQGTLIAIGEPILDEFNDIDKAITDIFNGIRKNLTDSDGALVPVIDSVEQLASTAADVIRGMADNIDEALSIANLSGFTNGFDAIKDAIAGLELESAEGLSSAIGGIGKAFEGLTEFTISAVEVLKGLFEAIGQLATYLEGLDENTVKTAGTIGGLAIALSALSGPLSSLLVIVLALKKAGGLPAAIGRASDIAATSKEAGGLTSNLGKLAGGLGLVTAGAAVGSIFVEWIDGLTGWSEKTYGATAATEAQTEVLAKFREETGNANATIQDYNKAMKDKFDAEDQSNQSLNSMGDSIERVTLKTKLSADEQANWNRFVENGYQWTDKLGVGLDVVTRGFGKATGSIKDAADELNLLQAIDIRDYEGQFDNAKDYEDFVARLQARKAKLKDYIFTTAEASNKENKIVAQAAEATRKAFDRLDTVKPVFDFQTEKVKAQAEEIKAIFNATAKNAEAAGEALSSALGVLSSDNYSDLGAAEQVGLRDTIKAQNESLAELSSSQAEVNRAKAALMNSQSQSMQNGDALINIDGTNLDQPLSALFMEVIKLVQIQVANNEADFLLGNSK